MMMTFLIHSLFLRLMGQTLDIALLTGTLISEETMQYYYYFSLGKMTSTLTTKFYTSISGIMSIYKRYPKREDYDRVGRAIVQ